METDHRATPRLTREEAVGLLAEAPLGELMSRAHRRRQELHPDGLVTFVLDTNPNYTNVCETRCEFCAFCRDEDDPDAYLLTPQQLADKVRPAVALGATVLLQGGHHPQLTLEHWRDYLRALHDLGPVHVHPFSPAEVHAMAQRERVSTREVLQLLHEEGIRTLPGGGAEILTDQVRTAIAPRKCTASDWLRVMEEAHELGFRTTATLMFGHLERDEDIVDHFVALRELQDRTGGFSSFIPWSFKPGGSPLSERVTVGAHPARYVRIIALARLVLDNFDHIQSSWFSENVTAGQLGLLGGADDFGGVLLEENVLRQTGYVRQTNLQRVVTLIRQAGFTAARRDSHYQVVETYRA
jgi:cyclic dehypoxanthinyl futalosine synthase